MACVNNKFHPYLMNDGREFTDYRPQSESHKDFLNKLCSTNIDNNSCCTHNNSYNVKECINKNLGAIVKMINKDVSLKSSIRSC